MVPGPALGSKDTVVSKTDHPCVLDLSLHSRGGKTVDKRDKKSAGIKCSEEKRSSRRGEYGGKYPFR